jgi:RHS repeat-associated protein
MAAKKRSSWRLLGALLWLVTLPAYGSISASMSTTPAPDLVPDELLDELSAPALEHEIAYRSPLLKSPTEAKTRIRASDFEKNIYPYGNRRFRVEFTVRASLYLFDALGSPVNLVDHEGTLQTRTQYDAWGNVRSEVGESWNPFGFTGHELDDETGLYYARARFYDPEVGRFLSEDPFGGLTEQPPSLHRYLYAYQNPTVYYDPTGRVNFLVAIKDWLNGTAEEGLESVDEDSTTGEVVKTGLAVGLLKAGADITAGFNWLVNTIAVNSPSGVAGDEASAEFDAAKEKIRVAVNNGVERYIEDPMGTTVAVLEAPDRLLMAGLEKAAMAASGDQHAQAELIATGVEVGVALVPIGSAGRVRQAESLSDLGEELGRAGNRLVDDLPAGWRTHPLSASGETGSFGGLSAQTAEESAFLRNAAATFENSSTFTTATRFSGNVVIQRSDIPWSLQNVRRTAGGYTPFVKNSLGEWEKVNLHHIGRQEGRLIEITASQNVYNPSTGGPLHIPGPGGPPRDASMTARYWQQRLQDAIDQGLVPTEVLGKAGPVGR